LWHYLQAYKARHRRAGHGFGFSLVGPDEVARTLSARYYKDGSEILVKQGEGEPRRLTPQGAVISPLGNSPEIVRQRYLALVKPSAAEIFWRISPSRPSPNSANGHPLATPAQT
jgi:hypothetical protein